MDIEQLTTEVALLKEEVIKLQKFYDKIALDYSHKISVLQRKTRVAEGTLSDEELADSIYDALRR